MEMKKCRMAILALYISAVFPAVLCLSSCRTESRYVSVSGYAQGGTYVLKFNLAGKDGMSRLSAEEIKHGVDSVLQCIDNSVSGYNKGSILSRFNAGDAVRPDSIFIDIYDKSYGYYRMTGTAVDVACAPLFDIWGFGFTTDSLPSPEKVAKVRSECGMDRLKPRMKPGPDGMVHPEDLLLESPGADAALPQLNYNAVAQGYSCDLVAAYLESAGIYDMLVNIGGEIFCQGVNPGGGPWTVGVDKPVDGNDIPGAELQGIMEAGPEACGVVTSGNYRKFYVKDGRKYAHTVDPRTGCPVTHSLLSATIIAPDAAEADALATYCMVVGLEKAVEYIESRADIEGYLIYEKDGSMCTWSSSGFPLRES